ncbi:MAG: hypothetical protein KGZ96_01590 [Clostridia bacterium]|jgi:hypothetical protein|nr:hypothetical protein [Clostridia bacterium]
MSNNLILIKWPSLGIEVKANLLTELNNTICEAFLRTLPSKSIQSHAVVAGKQMYCPYQLIIKKEDCTYENMKDQPLGRINIEVDFQYLSINYGEITEAVPALALAQVLDEDIEKLFVLGEKVWDNLLYSDDYIIVEFEHLGGEKDE